MKKNIAIFFGGRSDEYDVSLKSAAAIIQNIDKEKFKPIPIGITRDGEWFYYTGNVDMIAEDRWSNSCCKSVAVLLDKRHKGLYVYHDNELLKLSVDMALPVIHGKNGEDGTLQGFLELVDIPIIGCGILSSALCMDKYRAHLIVKSIGIKTPKSIIIENITDFDKIIDLIKPFGNKLVIKPLKSGSSLGVSIIEESKMLTDAINEALKYDDKIIIDEFIEGNEFGCAVVGNENPIIGEIDEVVLKKCSFNYSEKYNPKNSFIRLPVNLSNEKKEEIKDTALRIYRILNCEGFARVDMFLTPNGEIIFNEVNTIPGFTENSRFPKMMKAAGFSMKDLLTVIIDGYNI